MSKRKPTTHGERFDALLQNIAAATGNDAEIEALRDLIEALWQLLTPEQEAEFFANCGAIETKAARWAGAGTPPPTRPRHVSRTAALATACECLLEAFLESGDLNDLPASQVIAMLQQALRRRDQPADNIAVNAARIAYSIERSVDLTPARLEEVTAAASMLHHIESRQHFDWEDQPADFETVCTSIGQAITDGRTPDWSRFIRRLLTPKGRRRKEVP
jgi:hypothetical protein